MNTRPFLPTEVSVDRSLVRAVVSQILATRSGADDPLALCRAVWPRDLAAHALARGAVSPASTAGWGAELAAGQAVAAFIGSLTGSAAAALIAAGTRLNLAGRSSFLLPVAASNPTPGWIAEGAPIPVGQGAVTSATLGPPRKLAIIEVVTAELADYGAENAETVIGGLLREAASRQLDISLFDATLGDTTLPAGLLAGVAPIAAAAGGGVEALAGDVDALIAAITAAGAGARIMLFMPPARAVKARILAPGLGDAVTIVPAPTLPADRMIAIDSAAFATGIDPEPRVEVTKDSLLHMEGAAPQAIGVSGSATLPIRSLWQTDAIAIRVILRAAWAVRIPGAVQYITSGLTW